ncbi:MAG: ATP-binding protein [Candidatus Margulisbacteria bacterium]|nr:ATP-binding protein [Candidatus Margulisiibacteriota bacterium]
MSGKYQKRFLESHVKRLAAQYPVVTVTGPRQSGKTTLCRHLFPKKEYVTLESIDVRNQIQEDPNGFIRKVSDKGVILDEIQRYPGLLSYIQTAVDENNIPGQFILTGSQNFQLLSSVSQSLAGRTALLTLLPYSLREIYTQKQLKELNSEDIIFKGFYPRIFSHNLDPQEAMGYYISLYIERDIRQLLNVTSLGAFETFLKVCASLNGQIVNLSQISNDVGISVNTVRSWLSILETSYIIVLLKPHFKNYRKRLIKSPKLYFLDTALSLNLLGIQTPHQISSHPLKGAIFEAFIVAECFKQCYHTSHKPHLYYFRDNVGNEVDLLIEKGPDIQAVEIKSSETMNSTYFKGLKYYEALNNQTVEPTIIYGGKKSYSQNQYQIKGFRDIGDLLT